MSSRAAVGIVPVRLGSTRLPRKALLDESGLPLFVHTVHAARRARSLADVVVATDDDAVLAACSTHAIRAVPTSTRPRTGSERCAEALAEFPDAAFVIDVQGDWPEILGEDLDALVDALQQPDVEIATLCCPLDDPEDFANRHVVKLVRDARGRALYFSRAAIPSGKDAESDPQGWEFARRHIGVYGFARDTLAALHGAPASELERREELEQLSWLHAGRSIHVLDARGRPRGIETRADYAAFVRRTAANTALDASAQREGA